MKSGASCSPAQAENPFSKKAKGPKTLEAIHANRSANGKLMATHHFSGYEHEPEKHEFAAKDGAKFLAHVGKMMGIAGKDAE